MDLILKSLVIIVNQIVLNIMNGLLKVKNTPELMLKCNYCKKVFWTSIQNIKTKPYTNHITTCKIKKNNIEYKGNIIIRS